MIYELGKPLGFSLYDSHESYFRTRVYVKIRRIIGHEFRIDLWRYLQTDPWDSLEGNLRRELDERLRTG